MALTSIAAWAQEWYYMYLNYRPFVGAFRCTHSYYMHLAILAQVNAYHKRKRPLGQGCGLISQAYNITCL